MIIVYNFINKGSNMDDYIGKNDINIVLYIEYILFYYSDNYYSSCYRTVILSRDFIYEKKSMWNYVLSI